MSSSSIVAGAVRARWMIIRPGCDTNLPPSLCVRIEVAISLGAGLHLDACRSVRRQHAGSKYWIRSRVPTPNESACAGVHSAESRIFLAITFRRP